MENVHLMIFKKKGNVNKMKEIRQIDLDKTVKRLLSNDTNLKKIVKTQWKTCKIKLIAINWLKGISSNSSAFRFNHCYPFNCKK